MDSLTNAELIKALDDSISIIKTSAIQELGKRKAKEALSKIAELLEKDENPVVRDNAAFALGEIGDESAIPYLIKALKDKDEWVRKSAVKALGILKAQEALSSLILLINDSSQIVRKALARTLGQIGDKSIEPYLIKLCNDESIVVKKQAEEALKKIRGNI